MRTGQRGPNQRGSGQRPAGSRRLSALPRPAWAILLAAPAVLAVMLLNALVGQVYAIPSGSMERTLAAGDRVLVNKLSFRLRPVHRGDVVVFDGAGSLRPERAASAGPVAALGRLAIAAGLSTGGGETFVKRVIGVGGDDVRCCDQAGRIQVNGVPVNEAYRYPGDAASDLPFHVRVPTGTLWVMGDHRSVSDDSRAHLGDPGGGFVPVGKVIGRAAFVVWPLGRLASLPTPAGPRQMAASDRGGRPSVATPGTWEAAVAVGAMTPFVCPTRKVRRGSSRRG